MKRTLLILGMVVALMGFMTLGAMATPATIDFGEGLLPAGGTLQLLSGGNLAGLDVPIGKLQILNAPMNNGVITLNDVLNFNTSSSDVSITPIGGGTAVTIPANSIEVYGTVPGVVTSPAALLTGSFTSFTVLSNGLSNASGHDTKNADLLAWAGLTGTQWTYYGFVITTANTLNAVGDQQAATSTDILNTAATVPEPSSLLLFGVGLLGLGLFGLKRRWEA